MAADPFADAFRRYWIVIVTVATLVGVALIFAGNLYVELRDEMSSFRSDLRDYGTERAGLLRDINGRFDNHERRIERLELGR